MKPSLLTQMARAIGLLRQAPAPPFGAAWFDAGAVASPEHDGRPRRPRTYDEQQKAAVWQKAQPIIGWDPADWRVDHRGNPIFRHHYGDSGSAFGWEVGQVVANGSADLRNLRPQLCQTPRETPAPFDRALNLDPFAG